MTFPVTVGQQDPDQCYQLDIGSQDEDDKEGEDFAEGTLSVVSDHSVKR